MGRKRRKKQKQTFAVFSVKYFVFRMKVYESINIFHNMSDCCIITKILYVPTHFLYHGSLRRDQMALKTSDTNAGRPRHTLQCIHQELQHFRGFYSSWRAL